MENFDQPLDAGMTATGPDHSGLSITSEIRQYWREIANWAMFFAVLMFIYYALIVLLGLFSAMQDGAAGIVSGIFVIGLYTAIIFLPARYYYKFSTQSKQAMNMDDTELLDEAFANLHRFYRYVGILTIVLISLYVLVLFIIVGSGILNPLSRNGLGE